MVLNNYETVFILNPVLSESQMKDAVEKFKKILTDNKAQIINEENWGLRKLAYTIQHKTTGFYAFFEFQAPTTIVNSLETEFRRDERVLRFLTTVLDKHATEYNAKRRSGKFNKKEAKEEQAA